MPPLGRLADPVVVVFPGHHATVADRDGALLARAARRRGADLPARADGREVHAAVARVHAGGVDDDGAVLPGRAARRIRVRAPHEPPAAAPAGAAPARPARARRARPADRGAGRSAPRGREPDPLAARSARDHRRAAVRRAGRQRADAPALARRHEPSRRPRPLLPVRREQRRQPARAARLPAAGGARAHARRAGRAVGDRVRAGGAAGAGVRDSHPPGRGQRGARSRGRDSSCPRRGEPRRRANLHPLATPPPVARLRRHPVEPDARLHHLPDARPQPGSADLGDPAGDLPPDPRRGLRPGRQPRAAHALVPAPAPWHRDPGRLHLRHRRPAAALRDSRDPPRRAGRRRAALPRTPRCRPAEPRASHRVLPLARSRRRPRRGVQRARRAGRVPGPRRVPARARGRVPRASGAAEDPARPARVLPPRRALHALDGLRDPGCCWAWRSPA